MSAPPLQPFDPSAESSRSAGVSTPPPRVHAHSPASLRLALLNISTRAPKPRTSLGPNGEVVEGVNGLGGEEDNVVISHPPSPREVLEGGFFPAEAATLASSYRPLSSIVPLDVRSLNRVPLSTPPRTPNQPQASSSRSGLGIEEVDEREAAWPLIVVTGGSGFIGSHTVLEILQEGKYGCVVIDSLANSHPESLSRVRLLASDYHNSNGLEQSRHPPLYFHACDLRDIVGMHAIFSLYALPSTPRAPSSHPTTTASGLAHTKDTSEEDESPSSSPLPASPMGGLTPAHTSGRLSRIVSAIHFAALKSVPASIADPLSYYRVNVAGTLNLIECLERWEARRLVFSSSCVVYGSEADGSGITEDMCDVASGASKGITNPYGKTKRMCEEILSDLSASDPRWATMSLRYTNPSGAHPSGYIGEDPTNAANLMPVVTQVLQGRRDHVKIFGSDYETPDGTGVRDYIHVVDLARAHLAAIRAMAEGRSKTNSSTYNLGTNHGTSVLKVIETLSLIAQRSIKIIICPRRPGDLGCVVCSAEKAEKELGWKAERGIVEMCRDLVNWQALNPNGYQSGSPTLGEDEEEEKGKGRGEGPTVLVTASVKA